MENAKMTEPNVMLDAVLKGRFEFLSTSASSSPLPGAAFQKNPDDSIYYATGIDLATCNGVIAAEEGDPPAETLISALKFFNDRQLPFLYWTTSPTIENKALQFGGNLTGIALDISTHLPLIDYPAEIDVIKISNQKDLREFARLSIQAFGAKESTLEQFNAVNTAALENNQQCHFLALLKGQPVGTATLSTTESTAGIWNLTTAQEHRNKGIGTALVCATLMEAKTQNYPHVMAILMPKGLAWGVFSRLGFQSICRFPFYVAGASADKLEL